jgi:hypothetical protein
MGKVPSATTLSSIAYLTESGRRYLYGKDNDGNQIRFNSNGSDNFAITEFSLFDNDRNYKTVKNFTTGEMPDIAGTSDNTCLKTASDVMRKSAIAYQGTISNSTPDTVAYYAIPPTTPVDLNNL